MERAVEMFVAVTSLVVGASHALRPDAWIEFYAVLHRSGRPGAFVNGALSLVPGAAILSGHWVWTWPAAPLTVLGCLLTAKGVICLLTPDTALRSMERSPSRAGFVVGGLVLLALGCWAGYCVWGG